MMKNGMFLIAMLFVMTADSTQLKAQQPQWQLVFSDEFNGPNGSQPDATKWSQPQRGTAIWSRWIKNTPKTIYIKNGALVCRAIPNKTEKTDTARMFTGAIYTKDKFEFQYGRVEVRMKTNGKSGNFPAIWMGKTHRVQDGRYGEIDIAEVASNPRKADHTVHTQYTQTHSRHGLKNTFSKTVNVKKWHVYGIEWTPEYVMWTVDGETTGIFRKPTGKKLLAEGAWTLDYPFFLILNQSVGDGRWTLLPYPDVRQTFETLFDWVRVYQRK
jgi:beta-glucanase (GH16 family)